MGNNNALMSEYEVFSAYGFKTYSENKPVVNVNLRDGYSIVGGYFSEEEVVKMIDVLETALAEARNTPDHVQDENDTLF